MSFWEGETYAIIKAMKATGNRPGIIAAWKEYVELWAVMRPGDRNAEAVLAWLPHWQVRPFYTAEELAPMWPALAIAVGHTAYWPNVLKNSHRLEFELDHGGLPRLAPRIQTRVTPASTRDILFSRYFIVERIHHWMRATPEEIEREFDVQR